MFHSRCRCLIKHRALDNSGKVPDDCPTHGRGTSLSQTTESGPVGNSDERVFSVLATLEECRAALLAADCRETAQLVAVAILDIRTRLGGITDAELKALCEEMASAEVANSDAADNGIAPRRRPLLRIVK
ncbi:hypothetical protein [Bradyrhizobium sp. NP1]|uniref:hypothetical protein n=1 Tax=Bradyrhizobium sp. NP1 TaxID=3049772 RepID=UPI0025A598C4|nr:hypothetical protein [Bradyrhizobium sp. NP1]WJR80524.1 hypothetical protein QOU61_12420 [Bradyrhizobium sp. NP1]